MSLRWQILTAFILANFIAGIIAAVVTIYDARSAAAVEINASMHLAERFVNEAVRRVVSGPNDREILTSLAAQIGYIRHVRVFVTNRAGSRAALLPIADGPTASGRETRVPDWFTKLVQVDEIRREMRIGIADHQIGSVILVGYAGDEIAEVWDDCKKLAAVALILNLIIFAILYFALGRVLHPLADLDRGLRHLEEGKFQHRLPRPQLVELAHIADRFNALADRLATAKANNNQLTRKLVTIQDDERRLIATELHDEIGPCLFGIRANIASLEQFLHAIPAKSAARMRDRVETVSEIIDKMQKLNRRLLSRIRPMALGHVSLAELLTALIADFERLNPELAISCAVNTIAHSYGDTIDLTVYRCVQEGLTNAERHSGASSVRISLQETPTSGLSSDERPDSSTAVKLTIRDNGRGIPQDAQWGFGLTGMDERVRALGGRFAIESTAQAGSSVKIIIPVDNVQQQINALKRSRKSGDRL
jgi:two-component system sensor histidine kinase UhpB